MPADLATLGIVDTAGWVRAIDSEVDRDALAHDCAGCGARAGIHCARSGGPTLGGPGRLWPAGVYLCARRFDGPPLQLGGGDYLYVLKREAAEPSNIVIRVRPDGTVIQLREQLFNVALTKASPTSFSRGTYDEVWEYSDTTIALLEALSWDGEGDPAVGWVRHRPSNRRRPTGLPSSEVVRP